MSEPVTASPCEFQDSGKPIANPVYLVDINGLPLGGVGVSSSLAWARNGQVFSVTTDQQSSGGSGNFGLSLFNPSSAKNIFVYSMKSSNQGGSTVFTATVTSATDPAYDGTSTILNASQNIAGATSVASATYSTSAVTDNAGTTYDTLTGTAYSMVEVLTNGAGILLPAGIASGVVIYTFASGASQKWISSMKWIEY